MARNRIVEQIICLSFLTSLSVADTNSSFFSSANSENRPISFGHNLSPTTEVLASKQCTAGFFFTGCGATDEWTIGFSPWMLSFYNLENMAVKFQHSFFDLGTVSHQLAYFNSNPKLGSLYNQTSISYWLTHDAIVAPSYRLTLTLNYMYFYNEESPFSLRREPFNKQAAQFTASSLNQFFLNEKTKINLEVGVLGLNYNYPNMILGASWEYNPNRSWTVQLGGSVSQRVMDPEFLDPDSIYIKSPENYARTSLHPEVHIQYWF